MLGAFFHSPTMTSMALRPSRGPSGPTEVQVPEHLYRIRIASGEEVQCRMVGELQGANIKLGDRVSVRGRRTAHNVFDVSLLTTAYGSTVRGRLPPGVRNGRAAALILIVLIILILLALL